MLCTTGLRRDFSLDRPQPVPTTVLSRPATFVRISNPPEPGVIQSLALARLVGQLADLLGSRPAWCKAVRMISYDIDRLCSREFGRLLETVSSTLISLELLPPDYPFGEHPTQGLFSPERLFRSLGFPLSSLRHLHLTINEQWEERIRSILPVVPNLQSLRLTPSMQYSAGWGQRVTFGPAVSGIDWPTLPSLRHLEVDEMHSVFSGMLEELVAAAPSLHHATFRDPDSEWQPKEEDPLLCALRRCSKLKYLGVSSLCAGKMEDQGGFDSLEQLSLEQQDGSNELPQLLSIKIPAWLPNLRHLFLYPSLQSEQYIPWCWGGEWLSLPEPIKSIPSHILSQIHQSPHLEVIQFPELRWKEQTKADPEYWGSNRPYRLHDRFILVRTYIHPADGRVFTHCRSYSAQFRKVLGHRVFGAENVWEEHTDYDGELVPANVLSAVYHQAGNTTVWTEPGRNVQLIAPAWEVLRRWKALPRPVPLGEEAVYGSAA
ncbi:hypothetical protein EHS25_005970 [Saitozyma podzolica]|uniref:F-box domain-containing protein n=1 Tax=Saitozyma podzolica TaxID=1890683 RepID=A0A427XTU1_9TREE|nr:hypothetical protein EHS25_005970 [Saitozyma podzolica]